VQIPTLLMSEREQNLFKCRTFLSSNSTEFHVTELFVNQLANMRKLRWEVNKSNPNGKDFDFNIDAHRRVYLESMTQLFEVQIFEFEVRDYAKLYFSKVFNSLI
jgi:hypothetical protein